MSIISGVLGPFLAKFGGWIAFLATMALSLLFVMLTKTASIPIFLSRIRGDPLVLLQRKDERYGIVTGRYSHGGIDLGSKFGVFLCSKGSFKPFAGTSMAQAKEGYSVMPTDIYTNACNELTKAGYNDLEAILADEKRLKQVVHDKRAKREERKEAKQRLTSIKQIWNALIEIEKRQKTDSGDNLEENVLSHFGNVENFNNSALSPTHFQEKLDNEVTKKLHRKKSDRLVQIIGLAILAAAICGGIAIILYYAKCPNCTALCSAVRATATSAVNL